MTEQANAQDVYTALHEICLSYQHGNGTTADLALKERFLQSESMKIGYISVLMDIVRRREAPDDVRWLASITLKNFVVRNWHRTGAHSRLIEEERMYVRDALADYFDEPHEQTAVQIALSVGRIARYNYAEWPALFSMIFRELKADIFSLRGQRALLALNHIVKEMISKALDRGNLEEAAPDFFQVLIPMWEQTQGRFEEINDLSETAAKSLYFLTKCILRLIAYGVKDLHAISFKMIETGVVNDGSGVEYTLSVFFSNLIGLLSRQYRPVAESHTKKGQDYRRKHHLSSSKLALDILRRHTKSFHHELNPFVGFFMNIVLEESEKYYHTQCDDFRERMIVLANSFLKCAVNSYGANPGSPGYANLVASFQTAEGNLISTLTRCIVCRYLALRESDIKLWMEDGEAFVRYTESDKTNVRRSAEELVETMIHRLSGISPEFIGEMKRTLSTPLSKLQSDSDVIQRDAFDQAVGVACEALAQDSILNVEQHLFGDFLPQLTTLNDKPCNVLHRARLIWLIGRASEQLGCKDDILHLLSASLKDDDVVVRLYSVHAFFALVTNASYAEKFLSRAGPVVGSLFEIFPSLREDETKLTLLSVVTGLVEHVGMGIAPYVSVIYEHLLHLWEKPVLCNLIRAVVLTATHRLVVAVGTSEFSQLQKFGAEIVLASMDPSTPFSLYLVEDSLDLWLSLIQHTTEYTDPLRKLYPILLDKLSRETESLHVVIDIVNCYIFLGEQFLAEFGATTAEALVRILYTVKYQGQVLALDAIQNMMIIRSDIAVVLFNSGVLSSTVISLLESTEDSTNVVESGYFCLFARVCFQSRDVFLELMRGVAKEHNESTERILVAFIGKWLDKIDSVFLSLHRKLSALALCSLLLDVSLLEALEEFKTAILDLSLQVIVEEEEFFAFRPGDDFSHEPSETSQRNACTPLHTGRKRAVLEADPLHTETMKNSLRNQLYAFSEVIGPTKMQNFVEGIGQETREEILKITNKSE